MTMHEAVAKEKNYRFYIFESTAGIAVLFDRYEVPKIVARTDYITNDIFGNKARIQKSVNCRIGGYRYKVTNLNFSQTTTPNQVAPWGENLYCSCSQDIEYGHFDAEKHLEHAEIRGICSCKKEWRIEIKVKESVGNCNMKTIWDLYNSGCDIYPALECHLFLD